MRPLRILHVMSRLPVGGVENQLLNVIRNYDRSEVAPLVCSLADKGDIGREIEAEGVEVIALNKLGHRFDWSIARDIAGIVSSRGIEVVRTHQYHANLYGRLGARLAKAPCVVASVHNAYTRDRKLHRRLINRLLARWTDRVVAVSAPVMQDILRYDGIDREKVAVIRNGVDAGRFRAASGLGVRRELGLKEGELVIGCVGRLTPQKGHRDLLKAVGGIIKTLPLKLMIVGDGPLMGELKGYASDLGISGNAVFTGTRRDIPELLAAMDVFTLPSLWEGLPNALLEALAAGKAVVASDIPSFRDVIPSDDAALLVPPGDVASLGRALERLLRDAALREKMGRSAAALAEGSFDIRRTVRSYLDLYIGVLDGKGLHGTPPLA